MIVPSTIPIPPEPSTPTPPVSIRAESSVGPGCPICHSDLKRKWRIIGRSLGCINEDCRNHFRKKGEQTDDEFSFRNRAWD